MDQLEEPRLVGELNDEGISRRGFLSGASLLALMFGTAAGSPFALFGTAARAAEDAAGEFRWGIPEEPDSLDAQATPRAISVPVLTYLGDSLLYRDLKGERVPGLAKSWKVSDDGKTVEFELREGVKFQDGTPFDAKALVDTFHRGLDPATKAPIFPALVGPVDSVDAPTATTFKIVLKQPYGPLLDNFAARGASWLQPISPAAVAKFGADYGRHPVSTGPWQFVSWDAGQEIVFERNPDYAWAPSFVGNPSAVKINRMRLKIVPEDDSRVAALESGELDYAAIPATAYKRFSSNPDFSVLRYLRKGTGLVIHFNFKVAPLDDLRVRQAMHLALDRTAIVEAAVEGQGLPAYGPLPPSLPYYWDGVEKIGYHYDPKRANALLDAAGWKMGSDGVREKDGKKLAFDILTLPASDIQRAAQLVKQQFKDVGIDLTLDTRDIGAINPALFAHNFQLSFMFWIDHDPDILYREFHSNQIDGGVNWGSYSDPDLDKLLEEGRSTADPKQRAAVYQQVQKMFVEKALWLPIYDVYELYALSKRVKGAVVHPDGYLILNDATVS
jgi:peptide/nickel transport system substrate-binding protein